MMRNKRLKLGIVSSLLITGILALAVIFNVLIEKLNVSWDLSQEQIYTISADAAAVPKEQQTHFDPISGSGTISEFPI